MPDNLIGHYTEALNDPDLLSLRHEIALQRAILSDLLLRLKSTEHIGESGFAAHARAQEAWRVFNEAFHAGAPARLAAAGPLLERAMAQMAAAMTPAVAEQDVRAELRATTASLEKLARSENSRLVDLHNMVTAERALALQHASVQALIDVLEQHVPDLSVRMSIRRDAARRLAELAGRTTAQAQPQLP